ncbi:phosphatase PAP2 family protein [Streptacidiphilus monticola]
MSLADGEAPRRGHHCGREPTPQPIDRPQRSNPRATRSVDQRSRPGTLPCPGAASACPGLAAPLRPPPRPPDRAGPHQRSTPGGGPRHQALGRPLRGRPRPALDGQAHRALVQPRRSRLRRPGPRRGRSPRGLAPALLEAPARRPRGRPAPLRHSDPRQDPHRPPRPLVEPVPDGDWGWFPSGHTATSAICFGTAALLLARAWPRLRWFLYGACSVVCLGVIIGLLWHDYHWLLDIIASLCLTGLILWTTTRLLPKRD